MRSEGHVYGDFRFPVVDELDHRRDRLCETLLVVLRLPPCEQGGAVEEDAGVKGRLVAGAPFGVHAPPVADEIDIPDVGAPLDFDPGAGRGG